MFAVFFFLATSFISLAAAAADNEIRHDGRKLDFFTATDAADAAIVTLCVCAHLFRAAIVMNDTFMSYKRPLVFVCRQLSILLLLFALTRLICLFRQVSDELDAWKYPTKVYKMAHFSLLHFSVAFFILQTFCQNLLSIHQRVSSFWRLSFFMPFFISSSLASTTCFSLMSLWTTICQAGATALIFYSFPRKMFQFVDNN